jgi:hypothetical protein
MMTPFYYFPRSAGIGECLESRSGLPESGHTIAEKPMEIKTGAIRRSRERKRSVARETN